MSNFKKMENYAKSIITANEANTPHKKYIIYLQNVL